MGLEITSGEFRESIAALIVPFCTEVLYSMNTVSTGHVTLLPFSFNCITESSFTVPPQTQKMTEVAFRKSGKDAGA
jgi:hypothetical protein